MERNAIDGGEFCVGNMAWSLSGLSSLGGGGGGATVGRLCIYHQPRHDLLSSHHVFLYCHVR